MRDNIILRNRDNTYFLGVRAVQYGADFLL